ncbi:MAG: PfkB family carbohydrate kinase, partial [Promicromonosporaceae bacterium]|nr:PfkB family carbohydrate kinase [Promicromonosporaceae bacterium]
NEEDFTASLGFEIEGADEHLSDLDSQAFRKMIEKAAEEYPNFKVVGTTMRGVKTATINDWGAVAWSREEGFVEATHRPLMEIYDRVGGGDSFASGLIYGLMELDTLQEAVDFGAAHAAIAMTTPGDTSTANLSEVRKLAGGGSARVDR